MSYYVYAKVGNQPTAPGKEHRGMKHGMIVGDIDYDEWGGSVQLSTQMKKVYSILRVPRTFKDKIRKGFAEVGTYKEKTFKPRSVYVDFDELGNLLGITNYKSRLLSDEAVPVFDTMDLDSTIFKDTTNYDPKEPDYNVVTSGSYTVGSGGDYATFTAARADIGNLTGNLTFSQDSDITETSAHAVTETLGGFTLKFNNNSPHNGDPTAGHVISNNQTTHLYNDGQEGTGTTEYDGLHIKRITNATGDTILQWLSDVTATAYTLNFKNMISDGGNLTGAGFSPGDTDVNKEMWNSYATDHSGRGWWIFTADVNDKFENLVSDNNGTGFDLENNAATVNNCAAINNTTDFANHGSATGSNNASEDATAADGNWGTGASNVSSITPANEFESETKGNAKYLKVKSGGSLATGGKSVDITNNTTGIRTNARPGGDGSVSIGVDELEDVAGGDAILFGTVF